MQPSKQDPKLIMPVGLGTKELQTIRTLCWLSSTRANSFQLIDDDSQPDIYVVDREDPAAVAAHADLHAQRPAPTVFLVAEDSPAEPGTLPRPFLPRQLLSALDEGISRRQDFAETVISKFFHDDVATVLVVDDSPTIRVQMEQLLKKLAGVKQVRLQVDLAEDGAQALQKLDQRDYDIVFLDVVLPGIDGYQVCKTIKKNKQLKSTPVVMLTSKSSPFDRIKGSLAGCDTYLVKPTSIETLFKVLEKYLSLDDEVALTDQPLITS
jgi:twitching motility two-component system response regulator PilG